MGWEGKARERKGVGRERKNREKDQGGERQR
jgi:hypothetical protein